MNCHPPSPRAGIALAAIALILALCPIPAAHAQDADKDPALEQYFTANGAYNRKLYPVAVTQYEGFLKAHPAHAKADLARRGLALSQYALKQYDKAMPHLAALLAKETLDETISRERLVMLQGQCMMVTGKRDEAKALFAAEIDNLKAPAYRTGALAAICDVSFGKGAWQEAIDWSTKLLAAKPAPEQAARALYQQGYSGYQLKQADAAIVSLEKIAALGANAQWKVRADYLLGECYNLQKDYPKAEAAFVAALPELTGKDAIAARYRLGLTRFVLKKYEPALADLLAYLEAAKEDANRVDAGFYIARCNYELGKLEPAGAAFTALAKGEGDIAARSSLWLARIHSSAEKDYAKASVVLKSAVDRFGDSAVAEDLRFDYANSLMAKAAPDWTTALALLNGIAERGKFSQMAEVLSQSSVCQHKLGEFEKSLANIVAFLGKHADHPLAANARFTRAENLFLLNRLDEAATAYGEFVAAHKEHPSVQPAQFRQAQIQHDKGAWDACLAIAAPMLAQKPEGKLFAQLPFIVGDCLFRKGQWAESAAALAGFLETRVTIAAGKPPTVSDEPNVDTALMQMAVASDRLEQSDKALTFLSVLVNHFPKPTAQLPLALAEQGRLAFEGNNLKLARTALERFTAEDAKGAEPFAKGAASQRPRVMYYLGWVEASEGKHEAAAARFAEVLKLKADHPLAPDAALQQGIAWVNAEKYDEAAKHFPAMLQSYPKHAKLPRLVYYSGLALARQEKWDAAKVHFKRVADELEDSQFADQALYEWAWCERRSNNNAEATKIYERLIKQYPGIPLAVKVQSELAELNLESGAQEKVIAQLTTALTQVKDEALREDIRYQLASAHFKKGDHDSAAKQFEQLLADYPKSKLLASILFQAGESRLKLGESVAARGHFSKAAALEGAPAGLGESIAMRLAETQALTSQHADAQVSYAAFMEKFPESRWLRNAQFGLAFAIESDGASDKAIPEYRKLLADTKVDLWTVRGRFQIGECLFNLQKYEEAVTEFVNVEINYSKYPSWQAKSVLEIARVLMAQGKKEQASERLKDVIRRYPKEKAAAVAQQYLDELRAG